MSQLIPTINTNTRKPFSSPTLKLPPLPNGETYRFHTMLKPSGAMCNIDCDYCFYLHKQDLLQQADHPRMMDTVLSEHIRQYIEVHQGNNEVTFTWQGGEPTIMGLAFFEKVIAIQNAYRPKNMQIYNDIQTNGLLLDDKWCQFLKQHDFMVGISIDGDQDLHDIYRRTKNDKPTFNLVMEAVSLLQEYQIPFNVLCVVNRQNAKYPLEVYRFLRDKIKPRMIQFLAGVEPTNYHTQAPLLWQTDSLPIQQDIVYQPINNNKYSKNNILEVAEWSVEPTDWGNFLSTIWSEWLANDFGKVFVDCFENTIAQALGHGYQKCTTAPICGKALALEYNGDLYACDHFAYPEYKLGNILENHEGNLAFSKKQQQFGYLKQSTLPNYCKQCQFLPLCYGDCPKDRFVKTPDGELGLNYLCQGFKIYYSKIIRDLPKVKEQLCYL